MPNLSNHVAIVTGSARGIGSAIAHRLAADGAKVIVNYASSAGPAQETVASITKAGGKAVAIQGDLSDPSAVKALFDGAEKAFGPVTILVNNAGVYETKPVVEADKEHFEKVFRANVLSVVLTAGEFGRRFKGTSGRIVNISSGGARASLPGGSVYCASKAAVEGLTRGQALELGAKGITVNAIAPGTTETEMLKAGLPEDIKKHMIASTTLGRLGKPEDIADAVAFVCSDDARWITGTFIDVSGGLRIG
ncbi:MAG: glucose 1-dehydrogenase [Phycisphaerales bacterium]|nr:glucose 1-dehydrogenase [Phycisphaerales bacterium]